MAENAVELPKKTTAQADSFTEFKAIVKGAAIPATPAVEVPEVKAEAAAPEKAAETAPVEQGKQDSQEKQEKGRAKSATARAEEFAAAGRFDEAKRILEEKHRNEVADLRKQLDQYRAPKPVAQPPIETKPPEPIKADTEPKLEDFKEKPYEDYIRAVARWEYRQEAAKERAQSQQQTAQQQLATKAAAVRAKYSDFDQVADVVSRTGIKLPPGMVEYIGAKPDVGLEVLYYLGQNLPEYTRIATLPPIRQVAELAWIEKALATPQSPSVAHPPEQPPLPVSKVPAPPRQLGGAQPPAVKSTRDAATYEEHKAIELARKAGRAN